MGREIRMVPPNYKHPEVMRRNGEMGPQPMFDSTFESAAEEWKREFLQWESGERPSYYSEEDGAPKQEFWEYCRMPPERSYYRSWTDEEASWFQVWETVSEGTPVTPPFATKEELIEYLVANGDFWDQRRRQEKQQGRHVLIACDPWSRKAAEAFVNGPGWAPSMVVTDGVCRSGVNALADMD